MPEIDDQRIRVSVNPTHDPPVSLTRITLRHSDFSDLTRRVWPSSAAASVPSSARSSLERSLISPKSAPKYSRIALTGVVSMVFHPSPYECDTFLS